MPRTGFDLGADLADLERAGRSMLPHLASMFGEARSELGKTDSGDGAFARPAELGGGNGTVQPAFAALRSTMLAILQEAQDNLELAGHALVLTAQAYGVADESAGSTITAAGSDLQQGYDYEQAHAPALDLAGG